jgi:hypothetical protein
MTKAFSFTHRTKVIAGGTVTSEGGRNRLAAYLPACDDSSSDEQILAWGVSSPAKELALHIRAHANSEGFVKVPVRQIPEINEWSFLRQGRQGLQ